MVVVITLTKFDLLEVLFKSLGWTSPTDACTESRSIGIERLDYLIAVGIKMADGAVPIERPSCICVTTVAQIVKDQGALETE